MFNPTTRIKMMKWECKTQLLSHSDFATRKKAYLFFCKIKTIEKNVSFYFFTACPTQNKDMNQLKH